MGPKIMQNNMWYLKQIRNAIKKDFDKKIMKVLSIIKMTTKLENLDFALIM